MAMTEAHTTDGKIRDRVSGLEGNLSNSKVVDKKQLIDITRSLQKKGAQGIILGCTELPLIFPKGQKGIKVYNSVEILARALLQKYYK